MNHIGLHPTPEMYRAKLEIDCQCARCGSSMDFEECHFCEDGLSGHECGEDTCCCLQPEPNVLCDMCDGEGKWARCLSSPEYCEDNPLPGREHIPRGKIEWFTFKRKDE